MARLEGGTRWRGCSHARRIEPPPPTCSSRHCYKAWSNPQFLNPHPASSTRISTPYQPHQPTISTSILTMNFLRLASLVTLATTANAFTVWMFPNLPDQGCGVGYAYAGCSNMPSYACCTPPAGMAGMIVENTSNFDCYGVWIHDYPNCPEGEHFTGTTLPVGENVCLHLINTPIHSAKPYRCIPGFGRRSLEPVSGASEGSEKECRQFDTAVYTDEDGMEVLVEIPEGKAAEVVEHVKKNDVKELKKLKVKQRRAGRSGAGIQRLGRN
ncbi:hypothetical protein BJ508DRAFT_89853 [Ascobolus immersus RN42]|uniref:Uncharacterized protein n=1 Tax=Ascobolus immersus RN42 TaxID=1160509 RepID=A0A3N4HAK3_ASCIM|nr:hypothetical protein BJ508DRAFT_89853 [Ascobolus immersus RN42]